MEIDYLCSETFLGIKRKKLLKTFTDKLLEDEKFRYYFLITLKNAGIIDDFEIELEAENTKKNQGEVIEKKEKFSKKKAGVPL